MYKVNDWATEFTNKKFNAGSVYRNYKVNIPIN